MSNLQPWIRITIRIAGGIAIGRGWADQGTVSMFYDPAVLGAIALGANELWYITAKRFGWST